MALLKSFGLKPIHSMNIYDDQNRKVYAQNLTEKYGNTQDLQTPKQSVSSDTKQIEGQNQKPQKEKINADNLDVPKQKQAKRHKQA